MMYLVRFVMGLSSSIAYVNVGVYISETTHKSVRSTLGALQEGNAVTYIYND